MNRLVKIIGEMSREDLMLLQKDLDAGNLHKLIQRRLGEMEPTKSCPVCGSELTKNEQKYTLEFGPAGLRQRAYFDEYDCLQYFLKKLNSPAGEPAPIPGVSGDNE